MTQASDMEITLGYLLAGIIVILLWVGAGIVLLPLMPLLAVIHAWRGACLTGHGRHQHLWLARHHLWATAGLVFILGLVLIGIPVAVQSGTTIVNTLMQAPNPGETLLAALPALGLPRIIGLGLVALVCWVAITVWLGVRLLRHWLGRHDSPQA